MPRLNRQGGINNWTIRPVGNVFQLYGSYCGQVENRTNRDDGNVIGWAGYNAALALPGQKLSPLPVNVAPADNGPYHFVIKKFRVKYMPNSMVQGRDTQPSGTTLPASAFIHIGYGKKDLVNERLTDVQGTQVRNDQPLPAEIFHYGYEALNPSAFTPTATLARMRDQAVIRDSAGGFEYVGDTVLRRVNLHGLIAANGENFEMWDDYYGGRLLTDNSYENMSLILTPEDWIYYACSFALPYREDEQTGNTQLQFCDAVEFDIAGYYAPNLEDLIPYI